MRTSRKQPIDWLLPQTRKRILGLLLLSPEKRWHLREIARRTHVSVATAQQEVTGLAAAEVLRKSRDGNRTYYQANPVCPLLGELTGLLRKTAGLADVLREALSPLATDIASAFIYGSQASGEAGASSDVDLLVIGEVDEMALHRAVGRAERKLARAVNYTVLSRREFARRRREKGGFLARVLAAEKIMLKGDLDEL
jgi:predicted nucleotidyltransferase